VFVLRHGHDLSLKNIAEKLGYKGSSGPKYPLDSAERKLRFFLRDLPWLSPDDLNKEAFSLFRDTLLGELSVVSCRLPVVGCQLQRTTDHGQLTTDN